MTDLTEREKQIARSGEVIPMPGCAPGVLASPLNPPREIDRALVESGYMDLAEYLKKWSK